MKKLKTVVVGAGRIGWRFHIPGVINHPGFNLIGVVDPVQDRLVEVRKEFGTELTMYREYGEIWKNDPPDLVVIASPTHLHAEQTMEAFENGAHVFCDKPMAADLRQADAMIAKMLETEKRFMVYQPHRALAEVVALRDIIASGRIGEVFMIKRAITQFRRRHDWQALKRFGGGMLNNFGAHIIDVLLYLAGSTARRINAHLKTVASLGDADDVVKIVLETGNDMILDIDVNMASPHHQVPWQVFGTRGSVVMGSDSTSWLVKYFREDELQHVDLDEGLAAPNRSYQSGETIPWNEERIEIKPELRIDFYDRCYAYFARGEQSFVPVNETREVMRVIDACRNEARRGTEQET